MEATDLLRTAEEVFDPVDRNPSIPDKLTDRCIAYLPSLSRVDVERRRGSNSWVKVNGFRVPQAKASDDPIDPDDIASMIIMIAQYDHEQSGGASNYRAKFFCTDKSGKTARKTFAFRLSDEEGEATAAPVGLEEQEVLAVAFDRALGFIQMQNEHITLQQTKILELATIHSNQTAPLLQTIEVLVGKFHEGLAMSATATQALAEQSQSSREAELRADRETMLLGILQSVAPHAMRALAKFAGNAQDDDDKEQERKEVEATVRQVNNITQRFAGAVDAPQVSEPAVRKPKTQQRPPAREQREQPAAPKPEPEEIEMTEDEMRIPLTMFAHTFRDTIQGDQWLKLTDVLSKKEFALFREATSAEDDEGTTKAILAMRKGLPPRKYLRLSTILTSEQRDMIMKLIAVIENEQAGEDEDEDEED